MRTGMELMKRPYWRLVSILSLAPKRMPMVGTGSAGMSKAGCAGAACAFCLPLAAGLAAAPAAGRGLAGLAWAACKAADARALLSTAARFTATGSTLFIITWLEK